MRKNKKRIYLDYAATTPVAREVTEIMRPYLNQNFGNPSSLHSFGQEARNALEKARSKVAEFLGASTFEIFFTGSATEANNLAILGTVRKLQRRHNRRIHIITTKIEHHSVLHPFQQLEREGVEVTYLTPEKDGFISPGLVKKALKKNTAFVSIMYVNNEIGSIQPIKEIAQVLKSSQTKPLFHTDAVQAVNYLDCDTKKLGVDLMTISGHKIYGPKGIGALFVRQGVDIFPLMFGGGQERNLRPGTENVASIVGLAKALELVKLSKKEIIRLKTLRDLLIKGILNSIEGASLNGPQGQKRIPNNVNISIPGVEGESLVLSLDEEGFAVSTGSACSSRSLEPSHVLLAIGLTPQRAHGSLRISLGRHTTKEDIKNFLKVLPRVVKRLRSISPF